MTSMQMSFPEREILWLCKPGGCSQTISVVKMLDEEVLGWWCWMHCQMLLETAYGRETTIHITGNSSHLQHANENWRHLRRCCVIKLHILLSLLRLTCAIITLSGQTLDNCYTTVRWMDYLRKDRALSDTGWDRFVNVTWEKWVFFVHRRVQLKKNWRKDQSVAFWGECIFTLPLRACLCLWETLTERMFWGGGLNTGFHLNSVFLSASPVTQFQLLLIH